ncbi:MAG: beta strand repeat-containing protein, partial [Bacteroidota bacterium]
MKQILRLVALLILLAGWGSVSMAQTVPGLIYKPATGDGASILDPNGDGYVSETTSGFIYSDVSESEIPYVPIHQTSAEPTRDVRTGPPGKHTDLVGQRGDGRNTAFMYYDSANDALLFRVRLAGQSSASKGYAFVFNTDFDQYGPKAANFSRINPGFQYEVVLETNFRVSINELTGSSANRIASFDLDDHFQKSISSVHYGTDGSNNSDTGYFYDFYLPLSEVPAGFRTQLSSDFRVTVATITNAQRGITGVLSDVLGGGDLGVQSECPGGLNALTGGGMGCVEVDPTTVIPTLDRPIYADATSVSGRLSEPDGSTVYLYKDGEQVGTATVTNFEWEITGLDAFISGEEFTARASTNGKKTSDLSPGETVITEGDFVACADGVTDRPVFTTESRSGNSSNVTFNGTAEPGAEIQLFESDYTLVSPDDTPITADSGGDWSAAVSTGPGIVFIRASVDGKCASEFVTLTSDDVEPAGTTTAPTITTDPDVGDTSVTVENQDDDVDGATLYLYVNGEYIARQVGVDPNVSYEFTLPESGTFSDEDVITARAKNSTDALSDRSSYVVVEETEPEPDPDPSEAPEIVGEYIAESDVTIEGFSVEEPGTVIRVYSDGVEIGETTVLIDNTWQLEGVDLSSRDGQSLTATAEAPGDLESDPSESVTILDGTTTAPTVVDNLTIYSTEVTGSGGIAGATLTIYVDDGIIGEKVLGSGGTWSFDDMDAGQGSGYVEGELYQGAIVTATLTDTEEDRPESDYSNEVSVTGITSFSVTNDEGSDIGTQVAGTPFDILVTAREGADGSGDAFEPFADDVLIYSVEAPVNQDTRVVGSGQFTSGAATHSTLFDGGAEDVELRALYVDNPDVYGSSNLFLVNNPDEVTLTSIDPDSKYAGEDAFTLQVTGSNFVSSSIVRVNGSDRTTNFVSSTELDADILASDIDEEGSVNISVINPPPLGTGEETDAVTLTVENPPVPVLDSISPIEGDHFGTYEVTLTGQNLIANGVTTVDFGEDITVDYSEAESNEDYTELTVSITIDGAADTGLRDVSVSNPGPSGGSDTLTDAFTVNASSYTQFIIETIASPQTAGDSFEISIRAADSGGTTFEGFSGEVNLEFSNGEISPETTESFVDGVWTGEVTVTDAGTDLTITATDAGPGSQNGTSNTFDVDPGSASQYLVTVDTQSPQAGSTVNVEAQLADDYENPVETGGNSVDWSSTNGGSFDTTPTTTDSNGIAEAVFTTSGDGGTTHRISATDGDGNTGQSSSITTSSQPSPTQVVFTSTGQSVTAGSVTQDLIVIELQDDSNTARPATGNTTVTLSSESGGGVFRNQNNTANLTNSQITIPAGVSSVSFHYRDTVVGTHELEATATSLTGDTQNITVTAGDLDGFLVQNSSGESLGDQVAGTPFDLQLTAVDAYENTITDFSGTVEVSLNQGSLASGSGTTASFSSGVLSSHSVEIQSSDTDYRVQVENTDGGSPTGQSNQFDVVAGGVSASNSSVSVSSPVTVGDNSTVTITLEDA